ncbi:MAG: cation:proton antiporter [Betaproteobacteria bacterium]|nr:cation:proton antiporter [Betaproteobacteria bacterium]
MDVDLGRASRLFYVVLFVITGASLPIASFETAGWAALAFVVARAAGKFLGVVAIAPLGGLEWRQAIGTGRDAAADVLDRAPAAARRGAPLPLVRAGPHRGRAGRGDHDGAHGPARRAVGPAFRGRKRAPEAPPGPGRRRLER